MAYRVALILSVLALGLGSLSRGMAIDPDESLYASIALTMLQNDDWVVPGQDFQIAFYKPPLLYWMAMVAYRILGVSIVTARLPIVLSAVLLLFVTARLGLRMYGPATGWRAAAVLATCLGFMQYGKAFMMDLPLATVLTAAFWCLVEGVTDGRRPWWQVAAAALAVTSTLFKGPVSLAIWLVAGAIWLALSGRYRNVSPAACMLGIAAGSALVGTWLHQMWMRGALGLFWDFFIVRENIGKFTERPDSGMVLVRGLVEGLLPWSVLALVALWETLRQRRAALEIIWIVVLIAVYLIPNRKLPHYVVPAFPALALLVAAAWDSLSPRLWRGVSWALAICALLVASGVGILAGAAPNGWIEGAGWMTAATLLVGGVVLIRGLQQEWVLVAVACAMVTFSLALALLPPPLPADALKQQLGSAPLRVYGLSVGVVQLDIEKAEFPVSPPVVRDYVLSGGAVVMRESDAAQLGLTPAIRARWTRSREGLDLGTFIRAGWRREPQLLEESIVLVRG